MAKKLNINLSFSADTMSAKKQLQDLQNQLNTILKSPTNKLNLTDDIQKAISATAELSARLQEATNINTGNLDFSKFNKALKQSGQSLTNYGQQLQKLGPQGQQAFLTLTKSIVAAEIPMKRTSMLVKEFGTTLANTARWQISSSILHGFVRTISSAYNYAQDLNESLNNIRIVTNQNTDQMAKFAKQANAAAKALSATTKDYTNASLIYYQQGLSDQQVKERTDITVKMANVSKQSAEIVSDQMTAVWNNFYNGSKTLEYYADVMTALGAATASSVDEISGGLEKFAAIGETIGLSYEYAAAALATITSNTRQSEEVVGTALKTIFARVQGLNFGETLEDGTTLNKYSEALDKVGIKIFDQSGELKKMDVILDEMAGKWTTLSKSQQTALAQTVAGTRQYTQLVALMDNWNKSDADSMKSNLATAYGSSGALQEQANIYAESWEAAQDRVTAAAENIYDALLNDEFFIDILNGFEKVLSFVDELIDSLGGLQGVFFALGAVVTKVFANQISQSLSNTAYNLKMMTKSGRESVEKERRDFIDNAVNSIPQNSEYTTDVEKAQQDSLRTELTLQMEYMDNAEKMSAIEADTNKKLIERTRILKEHTVELNKRKSSVDDNISNKIMSLRGAIQLENEANPEGNQINYEKQVKPLTNQIKTISSIQAVLQDTTNVISAIGQAGKQGSKTMQLFKADLMSINTDNMSAEIKTLINEINQMGDSPDPILLKEKIEALNFELEKLSQKNAKKIKTFVPKEIRDDVDDLTQSFREQAIVQRELNQTNRDSAESYQATIDGIHGAKGAQKQWSDVMVESANVAFNVASAISMVSSAIDTLKDPDVSGMQKLVTVLSTMGMVLPTIISLIGTMKKLFSSETVAKIANAAATWAQVTAEKKHNEVKGEGSKLTKKNIKETWEDTKNKVKGAKDTWNKKALEKKVSTEGSGYIKHKNGTYSIKGHQNLQSAGSAEQIAGKEAAKALGSKAASAGIAAAGIAVIIGTIALYLHQLTKAEKEVEKAQNAVKQLSENYDTVKQSYDNFMSAQSNYKTITDEMKNLTKGTVEYQEALLKANEAAGELLSINKDLNYIIENGQIVIDTESLEKSQEKQLQSLELAQAAKIAGQNELRQAEANLQQRDLARSLKSDSDKNAKFANSVAGSVLLSVGSGAAAGGTAGLISGGGIFSWATGAIGAVVGGIVGLVTGIVQETSTEAENQAIEALIEQSELDSTFKERLRAGEVSEDELRNTLKIEDEALIHSLRTNGEAINDLIEEVQANTAATNAQNDLIASNTLNDNVIVQNSKYKDQIIDIIGDSYGALYKQEMEKEENDDWGKKGINKAHGANEEAKRVFDDYLKYAGLENQGYVLTGTLKNDKNRIFTYKDAQGNDHEVSLQAMQAARASYLASQKLDENAQKLAEIFERLGNSASGASKALLSFVSTKNFEGATKGQFDDLIENVDPNDISSIKAYFEKQTGEALTDESVIKYGFNSVTEFLEKQQKNIVNTQEAWNSIILPENLNNQDILSLGAAKGIEKSQKLLLDSGDAYVDTLNTLTSGLGWNSLLSEEKIEIMDKIANLDWTNWDAGQQAVDIVKEYGIAIDDTNESWRQNINRMRDAANAIPDMKALALAMDQIAEATKDLKIGNILSEEDYNLLTEYNSALGEYFTILSDGSAQLTGDLLDFQQKLSDINATSLKESARGLEDRLIELQTDNDAINSIVGDYNSFINGDVKKSQIYNKKVDILEQSGKYDDKIYDLRKKAQGLYGYSVIDKYFEPYFADLQTQLAQNEEERQQLSQTLQQTITELAFTAKNAEERKSLLDEGFIDQSAYLTAVLAAHNTEKWENLDSEEVEQYSKYLQEAAKNSEILSKELIENEEVAEDVALYTMKMNNGIETLSENMLGWSEILSVANKESQEYNNVLNEMRIAMSDLLGVSEEFLSNDFLISKMEDIKKAAEGDAGAIDRLAIAAGRSILEQVGAGQEVLNEYNEIANKISDTQVGITLNGTDELFEQLSEIVTAAKMTEEETNAFLRSIGFEPEYVTETIPQFGTSTKTETTNVEVETDPATGFSYIKSAITKQTPITDSNIIGSMDVIALSSNGITPQIKGLRKTNSGSLASKSITTNSTKTSSLRTKKSDTVKRYKEIDDKLEETNRLMKKNSTLVEQSYGESRFTKMRENLKLMTQENQLLKEKDKEAKEYLKTDKATLENAIESFGYEFKFDDFGNISNYEDVMNKLYNEREGLLAKFGNEASASEEKEFKDLEDRIQKVKDAIDQYEKTLDITKDLEEEQLANLLEIQSLNLDILNQELELKLSINEADLQLIEYKIGKISDDFYQMAEVAAYMATEKDGNKYSLYKSNLAAQQDHYGQLIHDYTTLNENGDPLINTAQFIEESKKVQSEIINNLNYLKDLDKTMMDYYGDTLSMSAEELAKHTKSMEQQTSVLEHYASIMDILGKSQDYESLGVVLEAQAKTIGNEAKVAKEYYQMLSNQAAERKAEYEAAQANGMNQAGLDLLKKQWDEAEQAAAEAQDNMLAKTEEWAKAIKSAIENELNDLAQTLENALTADFGGSFDALSNMMERANSLQEEYLTTTNQIYETNKMMRTAQQEIDKSTNSVAKRKLKSFIDETEQLQNQSKLSKYELEIQQAKYDLLLAEIALEEAQNAKSTVRLTRDAEGNFGYVYTADSGAVDDAAQRLEDAQNSLYNIGLEGANEYTEKYQQTLNEFYDTITELQTQYLNGEFENELEYEHAMETARQYYYQKLQDYSSLYSVALTTDSRVVADAWSTNFQDMTYNTENWKNSVNGYVNEVKTVFSEWESQMTIISTDTIGSNLDNLKEKTNDIVTKNNELADSITKKDGVIDALGAELTAVSGVTLEYATMRTTLQGLILDYEEYLDLINGNIRNNGLLTEEIIKSRILSGAWGKTEEEWYSKGAIEGAKQDTIKAVIESLTEEELNKVKGIKPKPVIPEEPYDEKTSIRNHILSGAWGKSRNEWINSGIADGFEANMINEIIKSLTEDEIRKIRGFDTGGYTGSWGSYGKLAMLHEKELVLNAQDTENFLAGMDMLSKIIQVIDLYSANAQLGGLLQSPHYNDMISNGTLEQQVHIEANFPGVTNRHEIEEAFDTLVNRASQYANRK